ncbi:hypothetical protein JEZ13_09125 [bacterium]|nr:hypothetical protein [bacterium]
MKLSRKFLIAIVIISMAILFLVSCGTDKVVKDDSLVTEYNENVVQIVTWNLKEFPLASSTINQLQYHIPLLNADIIAVQEVTNTNDFNQLGLYLNDYSVLASEYYVYDENDEEMYYNPILGYIYNHNRVTVNSTYEILRNDSRMFPREPYVLDITWNNVDFIIINNHLKAGGDNVIDEWDSWDEEVRRRDALNSLHIYINENYSNDNVILLGDFNDQFHEIPETNVFTTFLNDDNFVFADYEMSLDTADFSYPNWPSHLDHIIINQNLIEIFGKPLSDCYTIKYDKSISNYFANISDHRPVIIKLDFE